MLNLEKDGSFLEAEGIYIFSFEAETEHHFTIEFLVDEQQFCKDAFLQ